MQNPPNGAKIKGVYVAGNTKLKDTTLATELERFINSPAKCLEIKSENKEILPPQFYSLNDLQKDAFRYFNYSAEKTLKLVQKLYEDYKCVSYPRTPSCVGNHQFKVEGRKVLDEGWQKFRRFTRLLKEKDEDKEEA